MTAPILQLLLSFVLAFGAGPARNQSTEAERAGRIKAGMVLNFVRFTEWPSNAFPTQDSPILVVVVGVSEVTPHLDQTLVGQQVHGRKLRLIQMDYPAPEPGHEEPSEVALQEFHAALRKSHVVFFATEGRLEDTLDAIQGTSVLTLSDLGHFAQRGGMLGLTLRAGRVTFEANPDVIQASTLKVSSKVLGLARIVRQERRRR
jgi:hypothetical protein